ncbi:MAG: ABC transporter ATP-binding protein [Patescibacteria group bacterium]|jgi:ABC-2 type transport system ATP-binding protein
MATIEVKNLKKHFGNIKAVDGISFSVEEGEIFGFLGPNGAGKTTTIRCMTDFIRPDDGKIMILGKDVAGEIVEIKKDMTYLPASAQFYGNWTGKEHLDLIKAIRHGDGEIEEYAKRLDFNPNLRAKTLSTGNKQKLGILLALVNKPKVIILDEPTSGLDPLLQNTFNKILKDLSAQGTTIFMSSHNLHEVEEICGRVAIIKDGKLMAVESIRDLKQKRIYRVTVSFEKDVPDLSKVIDKIEEKKDGGIVAIVKGDINPFITELSSHKVKSLEIIQAPLDEIFLEFYGKEK